MSMIIGRIPLVPNEEFCFFTPVFRTVEKQTCIQAQSLGEASIELLDLDGEMFDEFKYVSPVEIDENQLRSTFLYGFFHHGPFIFDKREMREFLIDIYDELEGCPVTQEAVAGFTESPALMLDAIVKVRKLSNEETPDAFVDLVKQLEDFRKGEHKKAILEICEDEVLSEEIESYLRHDFNRVRSVNQLQQISDQVQEILSNAIFFDLTDADLDRTMKELIPG